MEIYMPMKKNKTIETINLITKSIFGCIRTRNLFKLFTVSNPSVPASATEIDRSRVA